MLNLIKEKTSRIKKLICAKHYFVDSGVLTVEVLHLPFAFSTLFNDGKVKRRSIWKGVVIFSCDDCRIKWDTHSLNVTSQGGAVVIRILHLDSYGAGGCL